jgi:Bax protein
MSKLPFPAHHLPGFGLLAALLVAGLTLFFTMATPPQTPPEGTTPLSDLAKGQPTSPPPTILEVSSARQVWDYYQEIGFTMANLQAGRTDVPRIYLASIIASWADEESIAFKKSLFYRTMLPLILRVNELIEADRQQLLFLLTKKKAAPLAPRQTAWLRELAQAYKVIDPAYRGKLDDRHLATLHRRVDVIPVSMALAQAAYESAYASSRFAREGNALFGQWRWGSGLLPAEQRGDLGDYRIADFVSPLDSMAAFAKNLNTHHAYGDFRTLRRDLRRRNEPLDGHTLAAGLHQYSEKGEDYVETLRLIISQNNLALLDKVKLADGPTISLIPNWSDEEQY